MPKESTPVAATPSCPLCGSTDATVHLGRCAAYRRKGQPGHIFHWESTTDAQRVQMMRFNTSAPDLLRENERLMKVATDFGQQATALEQTVERMREALNDILDSIKACRGSVKLPLTEGIRELAEAALAGRDQLQPPTEQK